MRLTRTSIAVVVLASCLPEAAPPVQSVPAAVRDTALLGSWRGTLTLSIPNEHGRPATARARDLRITLTRDSGFYDGELEPILGSPPPARVALGRAHGLRDSVFLRLGDPQSSDNGELELYGRLAGDSITGRWSQIFLVGGARGEFVLHRH